MIFFVYQPRLTDAQIDEVNAAGSWDCHASSSANFRLW